MCFLVAGTARLHQVRFIVVDFLHRNVPFFLPNTARREDTCGHSGHGSVSRTGRNVCPTSILVVTLRQLYEFLTINVIRKVRTTGIVAEMPAFDGLSEGETAENLIFKGLQQNKVYILCLAVSLYGIDLFRYLVVNTACFPALPCYDSHGDCVLSLGCCYGDCILINAVAFSILLTSHQL